MLHSVLIANRYLAVPAAGESLAASDAKVHLATVIGNMAYYGYVPSLDAVAALRALDEKALGIFWTEVEPAFKTLTGEDRRMEKFVVYKNFPAEVLNMSQADYWISQIYIYLGAPSNWFTQPVEARPELDERIKLKVIALAGADTMSSLYKTLMRSRFRWTGDQAEHALFLHRTLNVGYIDVDEFGFKENGISLIVETFSEDGEIAISNATDVLRLAAALSEGDVSLRTKFNFKRWRRSERKLLLNLLDESANLLADMAMRPDLWKKLLASLHPGDYKFAKVNEAYDRLYKGQHKTFNAQVEAAIFARDSEVLVWLQRRPGEFMRRLHKLYEMFGLEAVDAFIATIPQLETTQLLKLKGYLTTINERQTLIYPPKGNWTKAVFVANIKVPFSPEALHRLEAAMIAALAPRIVELYPKGVELPAEAGNIRLQTNNQELAPYGRGTVFDIPEDIQFVRTASYWKSKHEGLVWFDNGWNFFGKDWEYLATCCWNENVAFHTPVQAQAVEEDEFVEVSENDCDMPRDESAVVGGAIFSGDPVNSSDLEGRACQMIDLNLDALAAAGVKYAVWNVLCYSNIPFSEAEDVLATLQWGVDPKAGKLYEPSRAQMVFPLKGINLTKYIAYLDLVNRKLVYLDANLAGSVRSAAHNGPRLSTRMPAMVEYLRSLPTVADYFLAAKPGTTKVTPEDCLTGNFLQVARGDAQATVPQKSRQAA